MKKNLNFLLLIYILCRKPKKFQKGYSLYLDDERSPKTKRNWIIVRSYKQFKMIVKHLPGIEYASLDHDLGEEKSGLDCVKWLVENDIVIKDFNVHSANMVGAENIRSLMNNWIKFNRTN